MGHGHVEWLLTRPESLLLLTTELDTADSDGALASPAESRRADEVPGLPNDGASGDCGGTTQLAVDSANCETSGRGETDRKDAELASERASEERTSSTLDSRDHPDPIFGDCCSWGRAAGSCSTGWILRCIFVAARERD